MSSLLICKATGLAVEHVCPDDVFTEPSSRVPREAHLQLYELETLLDHDIWGTRAGSRTQSSSRKPGFHSPGRTKLLQTARLPDYIIN